LREHIKESLHQTGEFGEAHGGMDIVLCIVDPKLSKMQFAGAFNPLYIVTNDISTGTPELIEYKGDSMPVGIYMKNDPFTNHLIDLHDGDQIYIFSDGFIDQFGGPKNKKLLSKNFKNLILASSQNPICEQKNILNNAFTEWQGENPQTDDVLIMGIRYSK
jgi:serine phosphatase RsbU (regulator of sigma subunit)